MWIILAFWLLLPLPGLAVLARFDASSLQGGLLSVLAKGYLVSLVLLSPVSVLGYLLHWPVLVLSISYALLVAGAVWQLGRVRAWRGLFGGKRSLIAAVGGAWLLFDFWLGARVGSHLHGDAGFHVARVRMLLELGLGSWDPLAEGLQFEPIYHTNLYHALIAVSAQLAGVDAGAAWVWVWPFAKLMIAAASYELAWRVLGQRWLAWVAAITASAWFATQSTSSYPNTLAPFGFLSLGLAALIVVLTAAPSFRQAAWLGVVSVVLAQVHALYALFLVLAGLPLLSLRLGYAVARRQPGRPELLAALLCLGLSLPWIVVPVLPRIGSLVSSVAHAQARSSVGALPSTGGYKGDLFVELRPGLVRMNPEDYFGLTKPLAHVLCALALLAVFTRRREVGAVFGIVATVGAYVYIPIVCTGLVKLFGAYWVVVRLTNVFDCFSIVLMPSAPLAVVARAAIALKRRLGADAPLGWGTWALEALGCLAVFTYVQSQAPRAEPWSIASSLQAARGDQAGSNAARISRRARFFAEHVAPRATLMAPVAHDYDLPMHCNCRALAFRRGRGNRNVPDVDARRQAADQFYASDTPASARAELLKRYGIVYIYSSARRAPRLARELAPRVVTTVSDGEDAIIQLAPSP